jgi:signal transduction histidine kinase
LGISAEQFVGNSGVWEKIIPEYDRNKVFAKFRQLDRSGHVFCIHRIVDGCGLPVWVSHQLKVTVNNGVQSLQGVITPIQGNFSTEAIEPSTIASFIHKLGNHFQLMNLAFNSIRKGAPGERDVNVVQDALDKAIAMTRAFSEYSQVPASIAEVRLLDVVEAAITTHSSAFIDHQIEIERDYDAEADGIAIPGDPYLLELAVGAILQNAVEASPRGEKIKIALTFHSLGEVPNGLKLVVTDHGSGIVANNLPKVVLPFFSTKAHHDGLGLSMAARFVELHRGLLKITSALEKGTEVQVLLPLDTNVEDACH